MILHDIKFSSISDLIWRKMRGKQKEQNQMTVMNLGPPTIRKLKNDRSLSQCNVKTIQLYMPQNYGLQNRM